MSDKNDSEKTTPPRPSIKVSLPVELYYRRMSRLEDEAYREYSAMKEREDAKNDDDKNSETESIGRPINQANVSEQKPPDVKDQAPPTKPVLPELLGIPVASSETPRPVQQQSYLRSTNRLYPYRSRHLESRAQRAQRLHDLNNNAIAQRQQSLIPGHHENWQRPPLTNNVPTTQYGPKFT